MDLNKLVYDYDCILHNQACNIKTLQDKKNELETAKIIVAKYTQLILDVKKSIPDLECTIFNDKIFIDENRDIVSDARPLISKLIKLENKRENILLVKKAVKVWRELN